MSNNEAIAAFFDPEATRRPELATMPGEPASGVIRYLLTHLGDDSMGSKASRLQSVLRCSYGRRTDLYYGRIPYSDREIATILAALDVDPEWFDDLCAQRAEQVDPDAQHRAARESGHSIAALVWNAADDREFLDQALARVLSDDAPQITKKQRRYANYHIRVALLALANEIRLTMPDRQPMGREDG